MSADCQETLMDRDRTTFSSGLNLKLFVRHGDEADAIAFYTRGLQAQLIERHFLADGVLVGATLELAGARLMVSGANPERDREPGRGGPCSPHALGATSVVLDLEVDDVATAMLAASLAGAQVRNPVELLADGKSVGVVTDPFGHIWQIHDKAAVDTVAQAA
jgi:uncharacterized glyoxalase superfamily protein PhnB